MSNTTPLVHKSSPHFAEIINSGWASIVFAVTVLVALAVVIWDLSFFSRLWSARNDVASSETDDNFLVDELYYLIIANVIILLPHALLFVFFMTRAFFDRHAITGFHRVHDHYVLQARDATREFLTKNGVAIR